MFAGAEDKQQLPAPTSLTTSDAVREAQQDIAKKSLRVCFFLRTHVAYKI